MSRVEVKSTSRLDVRRLAAEELYGTAGGAWRGRLVRAEFVIGAAGCILLGLLILLSGSGWALAFGAWLVATGMNYVPLAISAHSLSRPGALEAELAGADLPRELRRAGVGQLWALVPLAVVVAAVAQGRGRRRPGRHGGHPVAVLGYTAAAWCLGFAGVSAWQVATDLVGQSDTHQRYAAYASGLAIMSALVGVLKLAGAALALAAVRVQPGLPRWPLQLLGVALWGAFGLLGLYSAGNLIITVGTVSGLLAPSAAWTAGGGVTAKAVLYVLAFLVGAALYGVLAIWFHRRHHLRWTSAVAGLAGAPLLLGLMLAAAPGILGSWGLLPT
jgi:hypothetical protein